MVDRDGTDETTTGSPRWAVLPPAKLPGRSSFRPLGPVRHRPGVHQRFICLAASITATRWNVGSHQEIELGRVPAGHAEALGIDHLMSVDPVSVITIQTWPVSFEVDDPFGLKWEARLRHARLGVVLLVS